MTETQLSGKSATLEVSELQLIEQRVSNDGRRVGLAYVLWLIFGLWGIHNFYLGRPMTALFQFFGGAIALILLFIGFAQSHQGGSRALTGVAVVVAVAWGLSFLVDLFLIPRRARKYNAKLRVKYEAELIKRKISP